MTRPAFRANFKEPFRLLKVLPNYCFLSLGRSGMRSKMDYVLTLALVASIFFVPLLRFLESFPFLLLLLPFCLFLQVSFCLSNGSHMSTKWPWYCDDKVFFFPFSLLGLDHNVLLTVHKILAWCRHTCPNRTTLELPDPSVAPEHFLWLLAVVIKETLCFFFLLPLFSPLMHASLASRDINSSYIFKSL